MDAVYGSMCPCTLSYLPERCQVAEQSTPRRRLGTGRYWLSSCGSASGSVPAAVGPAGCNIPYVGLLLAGYPAWAPYWQDLRYHLPISSLGPIFFRLPSSLPKCRTGLGRRGAKRRASRYLCFLWHCAGITYFTKFTGALFIITFVSTVIRITDVPLA